MVRGRKLKLTNGENDIQITIINALRAGSTVERACEFANIHKSTFYLWLNIGKAYKEGRNHPNMPHYIADREALSDFSDAITRARAQVSIAAARVVRQSFDVRTTTTTKQITETRLRQIQREDGTIEQIPYTYNRTEIITQEHLPQARDAIEFLKRRDSHDWSEKARISIEDWRYKLLEDVQNNDVNLLDIIRHFGGLDDFKEAVDDEEISHKLLSAGNLLTIDDIKILDPDDREQE